MSEWEFIELGPTPCEEECEQLGPNFNRTKAKKECAVWKDQLQRTFPEATLGVKWFPHDFGNYPEVVVYYRSDKHETVDVAFNVEENCPMVWDEISRRSLEDA